MIGVSPPQTGKAQNEKVDAKKDLKGTSAEKYKSDFEKTLKEKLALKQKEQKDAVQAKKSEDPKDQAKASNDELRAEKKDRKSSGGTKKKMTDESEDKMMISNNMASVENEVEIPKSKIDLAEIDVDIPQKIDVLQKQETTPGFSMENIFPTSGKVEPEISFDTAQTVEPTQSFDLKSLPVADQANQVSQVNEANSALSAPQLQAQTQTMTELEKELSDEVGFNSDLDYAGQDVSIVEKMKAFEIEKNMSPEKAQAFEQTVLDKLQKQSILQMGSPQSQDFSSKKDDQQSTDFTQDFKSDSIGQSAAQHAGQSHGEFKNNILNSTSLAQESTALQKLEDHSEKNIQEVMNKAQFLVKQGGGEMTVQMSPDGLGEVQLKVILQDGKVNIQMQTQDKAVKKMIEDSLSELKSGLAAHRLSVEHVKIDTVNATNTDNSAKFQSNWNQSGADDRQREYWKQFQDNLNQNKSRRGNYAETQSALASTSTDRATRIQPSNAQSLRTYGGTKGASVNKVA